MATSLPPATGNPYSVIVSSEVVSTAGVIDQAQWGVRTAAFLLKKALKFYLRHKTAIDKALDLLQGSAGGIVISGPPNPNAHAGDVKAAIQTLADNLAVLDNMNPVGAG